MDLEKLRALRKNESVNLRPSPYLRESFVDEYGDVQKVVVRNYQAQGIMNLLYVHRTVLGDDTGLGKTLEVLSAIGYVWMVEPEYVPIVVTKKSSLFQWASETKKFMQDMEAVVVDDEPFERDRVYRDFFGGHDPSRKRLLVMTYDIFLKDASKSVVRDRSKKPTKEARRALEEAKAARKSAEEALEKRKGEFSGRFSGSDPTVKAYLVERLKPSDREAPPPAPPPGWSAADESVASAFGAARSARDEAELAVQRARDAVEPPVLVPGVHEHVKAFREAHPNAQIMFILDEVHVAKDPRGKLHEKLRELALTCERVIGMTATPVKNRLMEFWAIFRIVQPSLFPKVTWFHRDHCIVKMQKIGRGKQIPIVIGHSKEQLESFNQKVEPFYLSRRKADVAKELPELVTREVVCQLSPEQEELYDLAEASLEADDEDPDADRTQVLKSMTMVQQACNAPQLLMDDEGVPFEGESSKLEALVEIIQDSPDQKVLVFSRFEKMITLIEERLKREKVLCVRITGKENKAKDRADNVARFQSPSSGVNVLLMTTAGTESLNLQATEQIVLVDNPWSWGDYVQLTGRAVRIGSKNLTVLVTHLVARKRNGDKTIDDYVVKALRGKKKLADTVAGEALKGGLEFAEEDVVNEVMRLVRQARQEKGPEEVRARIKTIRSTSKKKPAKARPAVPPPDDVLDRIDLSDIV